MIVRSMIWSLSIKSLRTLEPLHTHKFPRVNAQDCKLGPIQPWGVKDFLRPGRGRAVNLCEEPTEAPDGDSGAARSPGTNAIKRSW